MSQIFVIFREVVGVHDVQDVPDDPDVPDVWATVMTTMAVTVHQQPV
jgi:hypothetical protein